MTDFKVELVAELRALAKTMLDVATTMDYFGGFDGEMVQHAAELASASAMVMTWADGIDGESEVSNAN